MAPGVAWGLWRPIFRALEPALAAQLAVSGQWVGLCFQVLLCHVDTVNTQRCRVPSCNATQCNGWLTKGSPLNNASVTAMQCKSMLYPPRVQSVQEQQEQQQDRGKLQAALGWAAALLSSSLAAYRPCFAKQTSTKRVVCPFSCTAMHAGGSGAAAGRGQAAGSAGVGCGMQRRRWWWCRSCWRCAHVCGWRGGRGGGGGGDAGPGRSRWVCICVDSRMEGMFCCPTCCRRFCLHALDVPALLLDDAVFSPDAIAGSVQSPETIEAAQKAAAEADLPLDVPALLSDHVLCSPMPPQVQSKPRR